MIQIQSLHKSYGAATVLAGVSFLINPGEHVGLVGPNGAGKTTLLRCLVGIEQPDRGTVVRTPRDLTIGYLTQAHDDLVGGTVATAIAAAQAAVRSAEALLQRYADELAARPTDPTALAAYDMALSRFEALGGYEYEQHAAAVLDGLGLAALNPDTPVVALSGGQKTRLGLAVLLLASPDLLLLDEPTNHLDVEALEWLEGFVQSYKGAALVVSHDRAFLDQTTTRTLFLDPKTRTLHSYTGGYSAFAEARAHEHEQQEESWRRQQEYVARVEADIARMRGGAASIEGQSTPTDRDAKFFRDNRTTAAKMARQAKARERKLERYLANEERVERPRRDWGLKLDFGPPPPGGQAVLRLEDLSFAYPGQPLLLHEVSLDINEGERIALVGPNGAGKTTLLRLMAGELAPTSGRVRLGMNVRVGSAAQEHETLRLDLSVLENIRQAYPFDETEARTFLHRFLFGGDSVFRLVSACSQGERSRLQLALLMLRGRNLLLLDEPLNHLDIEGREHFTEALDAFEGTAIVVAHDRTFINQWATRLIEVRDGQAVFKVGHVQRRRSQ